ncbi:hypothetical protein EJB05_04742, partial [Eragrostis curvula]
MNVHCNGCARKIRKTARDVNGVENVWASPETGVVVVTGNADAEALRSLIEHKTGRHVTVVSGGAAAEDQAPDGWRMTRLASPRHAPPPDGWWTTQHLPSSRHAPQPTTHLPSSRRATPQDAPDQWWTTHLASSRHAPPPPPMQGYPPYLHLAPPPPQYAPYPPTAYPYHGSGHGNQWSLV